MLLQLPLEGILYKQFDDLKSARQRGVKHSAKSHRVFISYLDCLAGLFCVQFSKRNVCHNVVPVTLSL